MRSVSTYIGVIGGILGAGINGGIESKDENGNKIDFSIPLTFKNQA